MLGSSRQNQANMFSVLFNNFQLRDKQQLIARLKDQSCHAEFELAVKAFVDEFVQSYSADAPYPKRIGRWVGLHAPEGVIERLVSWASELDANGQAIRYRHEFRAALNLARSIDRNSRPTVEAA